ncbi:hypothetical protein LS68_009295 [Helicobacter sp. MIT 05-5293]|uniref:HipA domain-containing protein n=1 Tax=unclassified Helicobacter TaxID=2593540 RepID=UPI00051DE62D|nr:MULTISPECIES: HipA domain-containing protein [unclassified Helicobacter]TLD79854.1 hypothetical protein LS68_009295 [Helicobacter sp. MIT 05-5293]TLD85527.1 hypothetical protein LS69_009045 [Helicobacter sp. MIT 05-5294]
MLEFDSKTLVEPLGTKEKFWTFKENTKYLFKIGRENTDENVSEKIAYEIAKLIQLPCAEYKLALFKNGIVKKGIASKNFLNDDSRLVLGNELLAKFFKDYHKDKRYKLREYTIDKPIILFYSFDKEMLEKFVGYLVFDMLIGNTDRHHENWGIIYDAKKKSFTLAPSFDHAAGCASKVSTEEAKKRLSSKDKNYTTSTFCKKARTPFYKNNKKLSTYEVLDELLKSKREIKSIVSEWIEKISSVSQDKYHRILNKIPQNLISGEKKEFVLKMLQINIQALKTKETNE